MFRKKTDIIKKSVAFLLALVMLVGSLPLNVFAQDLNENSDNKADTKEYTDKKRK